MIAVIVVQTLAMLLIAYLALKQNQISKFAQLIAVANWRRMENKDLINWMEELKQDPKRNEKILEQIKELMDLTDKFIKQWDKL